MFGFGGLQSKTRNMPTHDQLIYAVGDVHGRADLLKKLLTKIDKDRAGKPAEIILLGDYVDRGPSSRKVFEKLA